jgi:hypothetical protein
MTFYEFQNIQRMDWRFYYRQKMKTGLHLKPLGTLQTISISQGRGLQNPNDIISRKQKSHSNPLFFKRKSGTSCYYSGGNKSCFETRQSLPLPKKE